MFTYNLHWNAEKSMLLYPKVNQEDSGFGLFHYNDLAKKCKIGFVNIVSNSEYRKTIEISDEIFQKWK